MDRKDGLIHMILGEKLIRWGSGEEKTESTVFKKKERFSSQNDSKPPISYSVINILETDLTGNWFNLICIFSKINLKKELVSFFSLSLAKKEST